MRNQKITINLIFWVLVFTYVNFSESSWNFFHQIGGVVWAKIGPEITGILFYLVITLVLLKKNKISFNLRRLKTHLLPALAIFILTFITRIQEFQLYFFKEDITNYFNRADVLYAFGPWISSHPALITELIRYFSGYNPFLYQLTLLISHAIFSISVYLLAVYFSKNKTIAFLSGLFFSTTTLHFEEFSWLLHPINYGWQALVMALSVVALVWQIKKDPKDTPLMSALLMMTAVGSGMAKTAPFFLVLGGIDASITFPRFVASKIITWLGWFIRRQLVIWALMFTFLLTRWLLMSGGESRSQLVTAQYYKIFLWLLGSYTLPHELMSFLVNNFGRGFPEIVISISGSIPGFVGAVLMILFLMAFGIAYFKKKRLPQVVEVALVWLLTNSLFFTFYGPHIPVSPQQLIGEAGPPHIAYPAVVGASILYGYLLWLLLTKPQKFLQKVFIKKTAICLGWIIILIVFLMMAISLRNYYTKWLSIAKDAQITNSQFFFESYMKFIPKDASLINVFYDDAAKSRVDDYKPSAEFFKGFWNNSETRTFSGEQELNDAIKDWKKRGTLKENVDSLYYIYTDYPKGVVQNLSVEFRSQILGRKIDVKKWEVFWGEEKDGWFVPSLSQSEKSKKPFYLPVAVVSEQFAYPNMLSPRMNIKIDILPAQSSFEPDLRPDIMSGLLVRWGLLEKGDLDNVAEYIINHPEENKSQVINKILKMSSVTSKILNPEEVVEGKGNWLLVVGFSGENANFKPVEGRENLHQLFYEKYNVGDWELAYVPEGVNSKNFSFKLPPSGRFLHRLFLLPLSKEPLAIKITDTTLSNPNLYLK